MTSRNDFTLHPGPNSLISGYGLVMAASVLAASATIAAFLVLRRQLIEGLAVGSVKG